MSKEMINSTKKVGSQGPLADTLKTYDEYDMNKLKDTIAKKG